MREVLIAVEINVILYSVAQSETSLTPAVTRVSQIDIEINIDFISCFAH